MDGKQSLKYNEKCTMKWKILTIIILFVVSLKITMGCKQTYDLNENIIIYDIMESEGINASCNLTLYKEGTLNQSGWMTQTDLSYEYNASKLTKGIYSVSIECNKTVATYLGECKFEIGVNEKQMIAIMIGLTGCLAFFIYIVYWLRREFTGIHREWLAPVKFIFVSLAYFTVMGIMRFGITLLEENNKTEIAYVFNGLWIILMITFGFVFFIVMFLYGVKFLWALVERKKYKGL